MVFTLRSIAVAVQTIAAQERDRQKEQARQGKSFLLVTDRSSYRLLYQRGTSFDALVSLGADAKCIQAGRYRFSHSTRSQGF